MDLQQLKLGYEDLLIDYECALRSVKTEIENVNARMCRAYSRPIISNIESRIKTFDSTVEKCRRKNYNNSPKKKIEFDIDTIKNRVQDVGGIRIITDYPDDIYRVYEAIRQTTNLAITHIDDYIEKPKKTGYWGLHLVVSISIHTNEGAKLIPIEIQIRDKNIDLWASIDHFVRYKKKNPPAEAEGTLLQMADILRDFGEMSVKLRDQILADAKQSDTPKEQKQSNVTEHNQKPAT